MQKFLAIDFGLARVGTAVSYGSLAEPLAVLPNNESIFEELLKVIREHSITDIIVGISEQTMAELSQSFGEKLANISGLPVHWQDEALSSVEVQRLLRERFQGKKQFRGAIDHFAAAKILERYLDDHPSTL